MPSGPRSERLPRRLTAGDAVMAILLAAAALLLWQVGRPGNRDGAARAVLVAAGAAATTVSLERDGIYRLAGPLGESVVEIRSGRVRMRSSPCPQQLCVRQGWRARAGQVIVCVPNRVGVFLKGSGEEPDAVTH